MKFTDMLHEGNLTKIGQKIAKLTDGNDHNQANIEAAYIINDKKSVEALIGIQSLHSYYGGMPSELIKMRSDIMNRVHTQGRKKFKDWDENIYQNL